jgi:Fe-Mn family superoxide dismutase|tara:strand:- start:2353 stop:2964 length:612 start_codon:yes stop_codon:yes gene_type:complete
MSFQLPDLNYGFDALEPNIDTNTMKIHHGKHHAGYTSKLNAAIEGTDLEGLDIENLLKGLDLTNTAVRNNGGGYFNHCLFWEIMSPNGGGSPSGKLNDAILSSFGSFDNFKSKFSSAAGTRFGSGWAWLCAKKDGSLEICSTANQDNPLMSGIGCDGHPVMGIDVWEHAYYLNYQNRRPDYINAFFNVVDWSKVEENFNEVVG